MFADEAGEARGGTAPARRSRQPHRPSRRALLRLALIPLTFLLAACGMGPRLATSADTLGGAALEEPGITISNGGGGELRWSVSHDNPYLSLHDDDDRPVTHGRLGPGLAQTLRFAVNGSVAESTGPLSATLSFRSNGGNRQVPVSIGSWGRCEALPLSAAAAMQRGESVPVGSEILVAYRPPTGLSPQALTSFAEDARLDLTATLGLATLESGAGLQPDRLVAPPGTVVDAAVEALLADPRVAHAQRNYYVELQQAGHVPTDPLYPAQWALSSFGLEEAWAQLGEPERTVVVAVIDSGVHGAHPDLAPKMLEGYDFFRNSTITEVALPPGAQPSPKAGHGTHVAGIAAAGAGDDGMVGVAFTPSVKVLPVKLFDDCGEVGDVYALVKSIRWAAGLPVTGAPPNPHPADVINMSVGVGGPQPLIDAATREAAAEGALLVAAAGNHLAEGGNVFAGVLSPANAPHVLAVGSVDQSRERSAFSNYGRGLDLMAPGGHGEATTDPGGWCESSSGRLAVLSALPYAADPGAPAAYGCMLGTSMAAPFVAGVAALLMAHDASLDAAATRERLLATARLETHMTAEEYGSGVVCADAALGAPTSCGAPH